QLADIFTDGMVLQREKPIQIWGLADAGTVVDIRFNELEKKVTVPTDGKWTIVFPPMPASSKPANMQILNAGKKTNLHNILIGDVWLCSGQSNMAFAVSQSMGADSILKAISAKTNLRLFHYKPLAETDNAAWDSSILQKTNQLDFFSGHWQIPDGASVAPFSAIGYLFGKQIEQQEHIPIGLIELAVGGSPLISWLDRATLESHPAFEPALNNWRNSDYLMAWCRERAAKNLEAATAPYQRHPYEPCYNFEAGVAKITKFPIKGVIWYQGESDAENAELYQKLFPLFVENWRQAWHQDFPFYYVQLSSISRPSWNYFRDMQRKLLSAVPGAAMVVTSDLGDSTNVHYLNKIPVGLRLANLALHHSYHRQNLVPSGPLFKSVQNKQRQLRISFLYSKGLRSSDGQPLRGFEVMDKRGNLIAVEASIEGDQVKIEVPNTISIDKIVYGWKPFNHANLINAAGLPASTFMASVKTTNENN
ncbi:MAG TPA: sialate O-acetylesterase, partial [Arachidicoccus sp.]|nr:sialate O-acetylesterase [Arachidicoccus sp.]